MGAPEGINTRVFWSSGGACPFEWKSSVDFFSVSYSQGEPASHPTSITHRLLSFLLHGLTDRVPSTTELSQSCLVLSN